jgi:multidrug resistance efflux pump
MRSDNGKKKRRSYDIMFLNGVRRMTLKEFAVMANLLLVAIGISLLFMMYTSSIESGVITTDDPFFVAGLVCISVSVLGFSIVSISKDEEVKK